MSRQLKLGAIIALLTLTAGTGAVVAGIKQYVPLSINAASRSAYGGLAETHNTADNVSYAECGSNSTTGYCTFRDPSGTYFSCYTTDPAQIAVIRSMSPDSTFNVVWDTSGVCTYVLSYASSRVAARTP
jgi:hypothetical protein